MKKSELRKIIKEELEKLDEFVPRTHIFTNVGNIEKVYVKTMSVNAEEAKELVDQFANSCLQYFDGKIKSLELEV